MHSYRHEPLVGRRICRWLQAFARCRGLRHGAAIAVFQGVRVMGCSIQVETIAIGAGLLLMLGCSKGFQVAQSVNPTHGESITPTPTPTPTATIYYVSPSGDDSNSGTSTSSPWKTVAKVNASRFQAGESVLFEGGQTFAGCLIFTGSNLSSTTSNPFTVGSYGTGRFTLNSNCPTVESIPSVGKWSAAIAINGVNGFVLQDAIVSAAGTTTAFGVWIANSSSTAVSGITVQRCDISGFHVADLSQAASEIFITGYPGPGISKIQILNDTLHGAAGVTSPDDNGVNSYGSGQNLVDVTYSGNTIYNIGGHAGNSEGGNGIIANGVNGGVIENNIVHDMGANMNTCGGSAGLWAYSANNITIQYNEVYRVQPSSYTQGCDWDGFDLDGYVTNSVVQYNYSHDNFGGGYIVYVDGPWSNNSFRYNIGQNNGANPNSVKGCFGEFSVGGPGTGTGLAVYNNTFFNNSSTGALVTFGMTSGSIGVSFKNNIFFSEGGADFVNTIWSTVNGTVDFENNDFYATETSAIYWNKANYSTVAAWGTATGVSSAELGIDPQLTGPGSGGITNGYVPASLSGYLLQSDSQMIGVGQTISNAGSTDYFGVSIPNGKGTGFNIGADGSSH